MSTADPVRLLELKDEERSSRLRSSSLFLADNTRLLKGSICSGDPGQAYLSPPVSACGSSVD
jgi:hypothetical protein